ncbi:hypothetical protein FS749_007303 [Ceratobasidium sp. UAMH 11750]|nr:hypothetical protein FS749_007303 [Ceratobasidium sp. UAMH 11750]
MKSSIIGSQLSGGTAIKLSSAMSASEIVALLTRHRCPDITQRLVLDQCGRAPFTGGGSGDVYRGVIDGGTQVAIKCPRVYLTNDVDGRKALKHAARELYAWSRLKHENVQELLGLVQFRGCMAMVSPWMDNGTLLDYIKRNPTIDRCQLGVEISTAVAYLHQHGIVHGDIKSSNVLISRDGVTKLTDFGCARLKKGTLGFTTTSSDAMFSMRWAVGDNLWLACA